MNNTADGTADKPPTAEKPPKNLSIMALMEEIQLAVWRNESFNFEKKNVTI